MVINQHRILWLSSTVVVLLALLVAINHGQDAYAGGPKPSLAPAYPPSSLPAQVPCPQNPPSSPLLYPPPLAPQFQYPPPPPEYPPSPSPPPSLETSYGGCNGNVIATNASSGGGSGEGCLPENAGQQLGGGQGKSFPLPTCYLDKDGFMCCNKELENLMDNTYRNISRSRGGKWKRCNIHQVAVATQRNAEKHFGVDFETVVGAGDFASKNYFNQDLICKIKRENSIILAFATPPHLGEKNPKNIQ